jgi:uncharacterized protein YraI
MNFRGKIMANLLNIRSLPSISGKVIGQYPANTIVEIIGIKDEWYEINYKGHPGFIHSDYVEKLTSAPQTIKGRVIPEALNVRSEPNLTGEVLGILSVDSIINILSETGNWLEIKFNDRKAFVHKDYVELSDSGLVKEGKVTADVLNVRSGAGINYSVVGKLTKDSSVKIISEVNNWYEIKFNEANAFVYKKYIDSGENNRPNASKYFYKNEDLINIKLKPENILNETGTNEEINVIRTWNQFGNLLKSLSELIDIEPEATAAVLCVESSGKGFSRSGLIIRFENHQFYRRWGKQNKKTFDEHFQFSKEKVWKDHKFRKTKSGSWESFHGNQKKEWEVFNFAKDLSKIAAMESISMGAPQIMGFNFKAIGYNSVQRMFENFSYDVRYHIFGFFDFLDNSMIHSLRNNDFVSFAKSYNGSGQAETYGGWIKDHFEAAKKLKIV